MFRELLCFLFPAQCAACRTAGSGLCNACVQPGAPPADRDLATLHVRALGGYSGALRKAVIALKDGRCDVAAALGERLSTFVHSGMVLIPVRTTAARARVRGLDGVETFARIAALRAGATVCAALEPVTNTRQRGRSRLDRLSGHGRFVCDSEAVRGRRVVLVDDVCTTGATLEDCAAAIRAGGGEVREAVVIALA